MCGCIIFFFFKQKTAYEMRISDWSSDVCSSDLTAAHSVPVAAQIRPIAEGAGPERAGRDRPDPETLRNEPQATRMSNMLSFRKIAAGAAALSLAVALPFGASAHRAWLLPSSTVVSGDDVWVTVDAGVSNDLQIGERRV